MAATLHDAMLGTEIGRYRLTRLLGEGGMGRVYLGEQQAIGSRVAIKILSDECTRNPELLERFFAEAKAVNLIRHENIISVLDLALLPDGRPYIIMEFIEGQTLAQHVRNTVAPLGGIAEVMGEVLSGLGAAHAIGIVHRDMKPDNVIVTVEGHAKVLDFGIAKLAPGLRADVSPRTKTGALLGTPAYMAPEQISGAGNVDARTDIYAAGIVLYEAVTGVAPFTGSTLFDIMRAHLEDTPVPPRQRRADLPQAFEDVILQAIAKDPARRFQSVQAMAHALAHAASTLPPEQWQPLSSRGGPRISASGGHVAPSSQSPALRSTAVAAPPTAARRRSNRLMFAAAALTAIGITLFAVSRGSGTDADADAVAVAAAVADAGAATVAAPVAVADAGAAPAPPPVTRNATRAPAPATAARGGMKPADPSPTPSPAPDPSVSIGPNVHIGPDVHIGTTPPATASSMGAKTKLAKPADYSAKSFDPVAYLPKALAFAQKLLPDAKLTRFDFGPVYSDGRVDLTAAGDYDHEYRFRSPSQSVRPANVPLNMPVELGCMIYVDVGATEISARVITTEDCNDKLVRHPRCSFASVWKQGLANGTPGNYVAKIAWLLDEQWFFDIDFEGKGGGVSTFPDRCP